MAGTITHSWNGTVLTITSDSGTSSMDLKGGQGDIGPRGPQGPAGISVNPGYATEEYVNTRIERIELTPGPRGPAGADGVDGDDYVITEADKAEIATAVKNAIFVFDSTTGRLDITV